MNIAVTTEMRLIVRVALGHNLEIPLMLLIPVLARKFAFASSLVFLAGI